MNDFVTVNGIYAKVFGNHKPARSTVEVARLPKDVLVEIECVARCVKPFIGIAIDLCSQQYEELNTPCAIGWCKQRCFSGLWY